MIWNLWHRCIYPLRCRFWDKDRMADAPVILLSSKAEVCAQPISPFPSRLHGGLPAAPGGDNGRGRRVDGVDAVVHGPHLAPTLHRRRNGIDRRPTSAEADGPGAADRADLPSAPERRGGTPPRPEERAAAPPRSRLPGSGGELRRRHGPAGSGRGSPGRRRIRARRRRRGGGGGG